MLDRRTKEDLFKQAGDKALRARHLGSFLRLLLDRDAQQHYLSPTNLVHVANETLKRRREAES